MTNTYDAICIGSGMGGLVAGALAAQEGKRVLVLEKHSAFGGAVNTYRRKGMRLEVGLHGTDGLDPADPKYRLFNKLDLYNRVDFVKATDELYTVRHPILEKPFTMPVDPARAIEATKDRFPRHADGIEEFFKIVNEIRSKVSLISQRQGDVLFWLVNAPIAVFRFWILGKMEKTTVSALLDRLFGDDEAIKFALCANLGYYGDDPDNFSLMYFSVGQGSFLAGGCHYIRGGSHHLTDTLVEMITSAGGEVLPRRCVEEIIVERGKAVGVVHVDASSGEDPREARAGAVFGNAAPEHLSTMLPEDRREKFMKKHTGRPLSPSLWTVHFVLDRPLGDFGSPGYSTFVYPAWHERFSQMAQNWEVMSTPPGDRTPMYVVVDYSAIDSGIGDEDKYMVTLCGFDRPSNWESLDRAEYKARKAAWLDRISSDLYRQFPGMEEHVLFKEMATALTMKKFINNPGGAVYGYAQDMISSGRFRPNAVTSVPGLFLSSSYALPGGGVTGAMLSGQNAFRFARRKGFI